MADENNSTPATSGGDWGSAFVSGLFNVGSGFLNNYFGKKVSKKEYQRAINLWNMQNEYNKPINQMARLREAGLNPNLAYGQLSNSVAGSVHAPSKENMSFPNLDLVGAYQDLRQRDAMTQQINAETRLIRERELTERHRNFVLDRIGLDDIEMSDMRLRLMEASMPSMIEALRHKEGDSYRFARNIGEWINALSPLVQSGANIGESYLRWHK